MTNRDVVGLIWHGEHTFSFYSYFYVTCSQKVMSINRFPFYWNAIRRFQFLSDSYGHQIGMPPFTIRILNFLTFIFVTNKKLFLLLEQIMRKHFHNFRGGRTKGDSFLLWIEWHKILHKKYFTWNRISLLAIFLFYEIEFEMMFDLDRNWIKIRERTVLCKMQSTFVWKATHLKWIYSRMKKMNVFFSFRLSLGLSFDQVSCITCIFIYLFTNSNQFIQCSYTI